MAATDVAAGPARGRQDAPRSRPCGTCRPAARSASSRPGGAPGSWSTRRPTWAASGRRSKAIQVVGSRGDLGDALELARQARGPVRSMRRSWSPRTRALATPTDDEGRRADHASCPSGRERQEPGDRRARGPHVAVGRSRARCSSASPTWTSSGADRRLEIWGDDAAARGARRSRSTPRRARTSSSTTSRDDIATLEVRLGRGRRAPATAAPDQLAVDDRAWASSRRTARAIILARRAGRPVSRDGPRLPAQRRTVRGDAGEDYGRRTERKDGTAWDLIIFEGFAPDDPARDARSWRSRPPRRAPLGEVTGTLKNPGIGDARIRTSRSCATSTCRRPTSPRPSSWRCPTGRGPIIPGPKGAPLLYAGSRAGLPTAVLAFEPRRSDLPLQVAFPILLANLTGELLGGSAGAERGRRAGRRRSSLAIPAGRDGLTRHPPGRPRRSSSCRDAAGAASVTYAGTDQPGDLHGHADRGPREPRRRRRRFRRAAAADRRSPARARRRSPGRRRPPLVDPGAPVRFAVDLFDVDESAIDPGPASRDRGARSGHGRVAGSRAPTPARRIRSWPPSRRPRRGLGPDRPDRPGRPVRRVVALPPRCARPGCGAALAARFGRAGPDGSDLMGITFDAPLALLLLVPVAGPDDRAAPGGAAAGGHGRRRARAGRPDRAARPPSSSPLAGFRLVLPVDRLATVFVVDLSDSVGNAGREDALAFLRETLDVMPEATTSPASSRSARAPSSSGCPPELTRDRPDRLDAGPLRDRHRGRPAAGDGALPGRRPEADRAAVRRQRHDRRRSGRGRARRRRAASRSRPAAIGLGDADEVLVERLTTPSTVQLGESIEAIGRDPVDRRPAGHRPPVRRRRPGCARKPVELERRASTRVTFDVKPTEAGFHTFRAVVEAGRDTFSQNDRADSNTIVKGEPRTLVLAGDEKVAERARRRPPGAAPAGRHDRSPRPLPTDFAGLATLRQRRPRRRLAAAPVRPPAGGAAGLRPRPRQGPGHDRRARRATAPAATRRRPLEETLPVDMGVRDRQKQPDIALVVVIDQSGSMDACHCNTFNGGAGGGERDRRACARSTSARRRSCGPRRR